MGFLDGAFSFIERFGLLCGIYARHELALSFKGDLHINLLRILDRKELHTYYLILFGAKIQTFYVIELILFKNFKGLKNGVINQFPVTLDLHL